MGIDPITHKPISQLLADLAGSMAVPGSMPTGNQMVGGRTIAEAALGCFKDEMLNVIMRRNPNTMVQQHPSSSSANLSLVSAPPPSVDHMSSLSLSFQRPSFANSGSANGFFGGNGFEQHDQLINNSKPLMHMLLESTPVTPAHHMASSQYAFHRPDSKIPLTQQCFFT